MAFTLRDQLPRDNNQRSDKVGFVSRLPQCHYPIPLQFSLPWVCLMFWEESWTSLFSVLFSQLILQPCFGALRQSMAVPIAPWSVFCSPLR